MIIVNELVCLQKDFITINLKALSLAEGLGEALDEAFYV